jgi:GAF domain-containing protein
MNNADSAGWARGLSEVPGGDNLFPETARWAVAFDTFARASRAAAAAVAEQGLQESMAAALTGRFADWAFVDLLRGAQSRRAVACPVPDTPLIAALAGLPLHDCPLARSVVQRRTPLVYATVDDPSLLGSLPDGRPVAGALHARSAAAGPVITAHGPCGAITIVRCTGKPYVSFGELQILSEIAELAGAAVDRLRPR